MENQELHNKINGEYELFYLEMMSTSRSNLYDKSAEIEFKKRIYSYLRSWVINHKKINTVALMTINNLLDECCRYCDDHVEKSEQENVAEYLGSIGNS